MILLASLVRRVVSDNSISTVIATVPTITLSTAPTITILSSITRRSTNGYRRRAGFAPADHAIQEFNLQSQFGAEYGRNSGSVVNIVTRSGTNKLHGSGFEFFRNSALDARNYFNTEPHKSVFQNNNFGASLGGPIVKDKTFFFGAYEGHKNGWVPTFCWKFQPSPRFSKPHDSRCNQRYAEQSSDQSRSRRYFGFFLRKVIPARFPGWCTTRTTGTTSSQRLTKTSPTQNCSPAYAFSQSYQVFPFGSPGGYGAGSRLPQFAQTSPTRVQVVSVSLLSTLSPSKINEVRFGYSRYRASFSSLDANFDPNSIGLNFGTGKLGLPEFNSLTLRVRRDRFQRYPRQPVRVFRFLITSPG